MKLQEIKILQKAGIIPYYIDDDGLPEMMFMVPSDPTYGGPDFQIAKGFVDGNESIKNAAVREGSEELGLITSNIISISKIGSKIVTGDLDTYQMTVYVAEVSDPGNFGETDYETGDRAWLTMDEYAVKGKKSHLGFVSKANEFILRTKK